MIGLGNLKYSLYSSLDNFGSERLDLEILAVLSRKPCKD